MRKLFLISALLIAGCGASPPAFEYVTQLPDGARTNLAGAYSLAVKGQGRTRKDCGLHIREDGTFSITNIPHFPSSTAPVYWFEESGNATGQWRFTRLATVGERAVWGIALEMPGKPYCVFCFLDGHAPYSLAVLQDARKLNSAVALEFVRMNLPE